MLLERLTRPLWHSTLLYSTASDLLRLQRCSHWCYQSLHDESGADHLLRRYFNLSREQLSKLDQPAAVTIQRLLTPLASLERQLSGQSPPPLHRALLIHAICASHLTVADFAQPHSSPVPAAPQPQTASWLPVAPFWELFDFCSMADPRELTLQCVGLERVQLWFHKPFWRSGWSEYLYHWVHSDCGSVDEKLAASERDAICSKLDSRVQWIGCVQPNPNTILAVGYYCGTVKHCLHRVPDTFSRPGYDMQFAYSSITEDECQQRMRRGSMEGGGSLPVVTFELSGSMETINGHQLHVYDSLASYLLCRAPRESEEAIQQVQQFIRQVEGDEEEVEEEEEQEGQEGQGEVDMSMEKLVAKEDSRGLPFYLDCFPMPDSILWNS